MSYNKIGFVKGQTLKAEHLNHMEEGIASATPVTRVIKITEDNYGYVNYNECYTANYDEIYELLQSGGIVWIDWSYWYGNPHTEMVCSYNITHEGLYLSCWDNNVYCPNGSYNLEEPK